MSIEPPSDWYIRQTQLRLFRGESVELPIVPEEPANVHSIAAARTRRATREMIRQAMRERPL
jgi:hypothetical protein